MATDPAAAQIENAEKHAAVEYRVASAEASGLKDASVDLITAAQAFHWFRHAEFYAEVIRVARPTGAYLAVWSYGLTIVTPAVDEVVRHFYEDILGAYWEPQRKLVEEGYRSVAFPFTELTSPPFEMSAQWSFAHFIGYLGTWSALHTYLKRHGTNPLEALCPKFEAAWGDDAEKLIRWPLSLRVGEI